MRMTSPRNEYPTFRILKSLEARLLKHADRESPRECCGLLAGRNGVAEAQFILPNISTVDPSKDSAVLVLLLNEADP